MRRWMLFLLLACLGLPAAAQSVTSPVDSYLAEVRKLYDGESALATTAYVAPWWRLPGNAGFDSSVLYVRDLLEKAGYINENKAKPADRLTYRLERRSMEQPTWEPLGAGLQIAGEEEVLSFPANRNLIAINSFPTEEGGVEGELVYLPGCGAEIFEQVDVKGKIVMADCHSYFLFRRAVQEYGALGVLSYQIPDYNQPEKYPDHIPFRSIPYDPQRRSWCLNLSYGARSRLLQRLERGPVRLRVSVDTKSYFSEELTLVAEIRGGEQAGERFVFSAHVQEPGANDNASGVGCQAEMARVAAQLVKEGKVLPKRTLTFLWGDEIDVTRRYIEEDPQRAQGILWGVSLDMVGEDTEQTGGTFLVEKMPDPSAIWTRGEDRHTEWGAANLTEEDLFPHYLNDLIIHVCRRQAAATGWTVNTNPFEGGSDHQPFLDAGIPGLLLWHFTDVFYHTDGDRIDKVSAQTLSNVGTSALAGALALVTADETTAYWLTDLLQAEALRRLTVELALSQEAIGRGREVKSEQAIIRAWGLWYARAIQRIKEIPVTGTDSGLESYINEAADAVESQTVLYMSELR